MKRLALSILAFITFLPILAFATTFTSDAIHNKVTFTVGGGEYYFDKKRHINNQSIPFIALAYHFTPHWGIEALLSHFSASFTKQVVDDRQINGTLFSIDGLYYFSPWKFLAPYAIAGVGVLGLNPNEDDANNEGNINAGLGLQFIINPSLAFRVEARDLYTFVDSKNDVLLSAGISYSFGWC